MASHLPLSVMPGPGTINRIRKLCRALDRQFDVVAPVRAWVTDITCIRTMEGFAYLAVVIDLYSRRVVAWSMQSRQKLAWDMARREGMTMRELALWFAGTRGHNTVVGTPEQIADRMEDFFQGGCDGFNVMPMLFPEIFRDFAEQVVPELQRRGLFREDYEGATLRDKLGLPRPGLS